MSTIATSPSINNLNIAPIERLLCCGIFDHTVKLGGYVNKINLESGGRVSNQLTRINHREYRRPRKTDREMHRKQQRGMCGERNTYWESSKNGRVSCSLLLHFFDLSRFFFFTPICSAQVVIVNRSILYKKWGIQLKLLLRLAKTASLIQLYTINTDSLFSCMQYPASLFYYI